MGGDGHSKDRNALSGNLQREQKNNIVRFCYPVFTEHEWDTLDCKMGSQLLLTIYIPYSVQMFIKNLQKLDTRHQGYTDRADKVPGLRELVLQRMYIS